MVSATYVRVIGENALTEMVTEQVSPYLLKMVGSGSCIGSNPAQLNFKFI